MLITIEGIDGTGKSTLMAGLKERLSGTGVIFTREPGNSWVGDQVRRAIAEDLSPITEALLFSADHAYHLDTVIRPALSTGETVISDRYSDSRYAYQSVTLEGIVDEPLEWLRQVHGTWTIVPDLTFLLVIPVDEAMIRLEKNRAKEHFEKAEVLSKVQENYLALARDEPDRFVVVDAMLDRDTVLSFVENEIRKAIGDVQ